VIPAILLLLMLVALALFVRKDIAEYSAFKQLEDTTSRQRQFRKWVAESFAFFAGGTLLVLAALGRLGALVTLPPEFVESSRRLSPGLPTGSMLRSGLIGISIGLVASVAAGAIVTRRRGGRKKAVVIGDIAPLLPRNGAETVHAAVLSLNAGLSEELFFRLLLPLLFVLVIHSATMAFVAATIVFGLIHLYQGWSGILATTVLGLMLSAVYLGTGSIWIAAGVHALIDVLGLVVRPALSRVAAGR
jgi:uncharacterized protein